jgi:hypothetical protein
MDNPELLSQRVNELENQLAEAEAKVSALHTSFCSSETHVDHALLQVRALDAENYVLKQVKSLFVTDESLSSPFQQCKHGRRMPKGK